MYTICKYSNAYYTEWNAFVKASKNGTFLFHRDFMEYHADRFNDYSLIVFNGEKIVALFPANKVSNEVHSHGGLTYGGLIIPNKLTLGIVREIFMNVNNYLIEAGIEELKVKFPPLFYNKHVSFEMESVLFENGAKLASRENSFGIDYSEPLKISSSKLKHFRRVSKMGLELVCDNDFGLFWDKVLVPRLSEKYNAAPVHSLDEINYLHGKFPENILQYNVFYEGEIVAGITLFDFGTVIKSQYGATTKTGEKIRALDYLYISLINQYKDKALFFDMGTVKNENTGLAMQKEELGCSLYLQDCYKLLLKQ